MPFIKNILVTHEIETIIFTNECDNTAISIEQPTQRLQRPGFHSSTVSPVAGREEIRPGQWPLV